MYIQYGNRFTCPGGRGRGGVVPDCVADQVGGGSGDGGWKEDGKDGKQT